MAQSALDHSWMDRVDTSNGVLITAEGLLMYLEPDDALALIRDCAARFPGGQMMFDSVPPFFSRRTLKGQKLSDRYSTPPMPFAMTPDEGLALAGTVPGVRIARDIPYARGRGIWKLFSSPLLDRGVTAAPPTKHHAAGVRPVTRYAAFLRGVNVGGVNLKMAEVAAALENAGFARRQDDPGER